MTFECPKPKCFSRRVVATGRTTYNRRGRLAAICRCEACGYHWPSTLTEAIEQCAAILAAEGRELPPARRQQGLAPEWTGNPMPELPFRQREEFEPVGSLASSVAQAIEARRRD